MPFLEDPVDFYFLTPFGNDSESSHSLVVPARERVFSCACSVVKPGVPGS
jgi:hypothetical protein